MPQCPICLEHIENISPKALKKHNRKRAHFPCPQCGIALSNHEKLVTHRAKHGLSAQPAVKTATMKCPECGAIIRYQETKKGRKKALKKHLKETGHFTCRICGKTLKSNEGLQTHAMALQHALPDNIDSTRPIRVTVPSKSGSFEGLRVPVAVEPTPRVDSTSNLPTSATVEGANSVHAHLHRGLEESNLGLRWPVDESLNRTSDPPSLTDSGAVPLSPPESPLPELEPWCELRDLTRGTTTPRRNNLAMSQRSEDSDTAQSDSEIDTHSGVSPPLSHASASEDDSDEDEYDEFSDGIVMSPTGPTKSARRDTRKTNPEGATSESPYWDCRICLGEPADPVTTLCGHIFCHSCITLEISRCLRCPVCKKVMLIRLSPTAT